MRVAKINVYKYNELETSVQEKVVNDTIDFIVQTTDFDNLNKNTNLYKAYKKANELQTIWFLGSYIWEYCQKMVIDMCNNYEYFKDGTVFNLEEIKE